MGNVVAELTTRVDPEETAERRGLVNELRHVPALDGLRGIAVLLVVCNHLGTVAPDRPSWMYGGWAGVGTRWTLTSTMRILPISFMPLL